MIRFWPHLHPITRKRLQRFRGMRRAWWSFWLLAVAYVLSLSAELLCNDQPLYARVNGRHCFPAFFFYSEKEVLGQGADTQADFRKIRQSEHFQPARGDRLCFAPVPFGAYAIIDPASLASSDEVTVHFRPDARVAALYLDASGRVVRALSAHHFLPTSDPVFAHTWPLPDGLAAALDARRANQAAPAAQELLHSREGRTALASLPPFTPRASPPDLVRLTLRLPEEMAAKRSVLRVGRAGEPLGSPPEVWPALAPAARSNVLAAAQQRFDRTFVPALPVEVAGVQYAVDFQRETIRFPFRPCPGHWLGIDGSGRDVLARILYGMRVSLTFGIVLVLVAMIVGTFIGALQGYYGGWVDLGGQRFIEIWESIPFLYIIILLGSIYGQGFALLLVVEALFGWIGISYYMRAEFLRLRHWPFVEAARTQGLRSHQVMFRHILPNALVPLITFFPFSVVGAIGLLAALDYLGFGLPPPTPSWGELLHQGQEYLWAWWLILYPALALFFVMLLCVFVGEGLRAAFDPKAYSKLE